VSLLEGRLGRLFPATPHERAAALWSFAYFFALLAANYVLRPLRDQMGIAGGVRALPWLFTATFIVLLVIQPVYGALVARLTRARFIPVVYHFFAANLLIFWLLLRLDVAPVIVARVFFVWVSVFNLFAVTVFWSFMADIFSSEQSHRLFGFIGAGGTAGSLLGPLITIVLAAPLGPVNLLFAAAVLLELSVWCVHRLEHGAAQMADDMRADGLPVAPDHGPAPQEIGGSAYAGLVEVLRSPYLAGIALWICLFSFAGTFVYLQQAGVVSTAIHDRAQQTQLFASIDLAVGLISLLIQLVVTGHFIKRFGVAPAAASLPVVYLGGFAALALAPSLAVIVAVQILQRSTNFALANPARHILFTVVGREEKYKAKNLIDVVVYRGSDALWGAVFGMLQTIGVTGAAGAVWALPVVVIWLALSIALGRAQQRRAALITAAPQPEGVT
jgi:AAA family ATP:ADP antiporter